MSHMHVNTHNVVCRVNPGLPSGSSQKYRSPVIISKDGVIRAEPMESNQVFGFKTWKIHLEYAGHCIFRYTRGTAPEKDPRHPGSFCGERSRS